MVKPIEKAGGLGGFEQHVGYASGQGSLADIIIGESEQKLQARFSSAGKIERCCEKLHKTNRFMDFIDI